jgi:hypothetical protein
MCIADIKVGSHLKAPRGTKDDDRNSLRQADADRGTGVACSRALPQAARFRKRAFGWKSAPAVTRVKEAVAELKAVARAQPEVAAEGAVQFLERVSSVRSHG